MSAIVGPHKAAHHQDVDSKIEKLMKCKPLTESEVRELCEQVKKNKKKKNKQKI